MHLAISDDFLMDYSQAVWDTENLGKLPDPENLSFHLRFCQMKVGKTKFAAIRIFIQIAFPYIDRYSILA